MAPAHLRPSSSAAGVFLAGIAVALTLLGCGSSDTTRSSMSSRNTTAKRPANTFARTHLLPEQFDSWADVRRFRRDATRQIEPVEDCIAASGLASPTVRWVRGGPKNGAISYVSAELKTAAGRYEVVVTPSENLALNYISQATSFPGAGSFAVHGSYSGRVGLYSAARRVDGNVAGRGQESHPYFAERAVVARCAYSAPVASGRPKYVW